MPKVSHEPCASRGDCYHSRAGQIGGIRRFELHGNPATPESCAKGGQIGGLISGRKNVESGQFDRMLKLPQTRAAQQENGRKRGRKAVESGELDRIRELPQSKVAYRENLNRARELPQTKAAQQEVGRKKVESGELDRIRELPQTKTAQREVGRKNVESGHLARIRELPQTKTAQLKNLNRARELPQTKVAQRENGRKSLESGRLTQNSYGIPCITSTGIHVKSVTEVTFFEITLALGGKPEYEPIVIDNYAPDFVLGKSILGLPANTPIELKPSKNWRKIHPNTKQRIAEGVLIVYANELWS